MGDEDIGELYRAVRADKQKRHATYWEKNTEALESSGLTYRVASRECYCFREPQKPGVDFYPSTGRWRVVGWKYPMSGSAKKFLIWYSKQ